MDDLIRARMHEALDVEQPDARLRSRVLSSLPAYGPPARRFGRTSFQWAAGLLAGLIAVALIASLLSSRFGFLGGGGTSSTPAGVPLLYFQDGPGHPNWAVGYDWTGKQRTTVVLPQPASHISMAPDGSRFVSKAASDPSQADFAGGTQYFDGFGRTIALGHMAVDPAQVGQEMWADDNRHVCFVARTQSTAWALFTRLPGQADRQVYVGPVPQGSFDDINLRLGSCSFIRDYAIVVQTTNKADSPVGARVLTLKLSNGALVNSRDIAIYPVIASRDGLYDAEGSFPQSGIANTIVKISDPSLKVVLDPSPNVLAFSADDSLVLVSRQPTAGPGQLEVLNWRSGQVVWRYQLSQFESTGSYLAAQSGGDFAIAMQGSRLDVIIVHADGTITNIFDPHNTMW